MRSFVGLVAVVVGVAPGDAALVRVCKPGGCQSDSDCKGSRICVAATCVDPGTGGATGTGVTTATGTPAGSSVATGAGGAGGVGGSSGTGGTTTMACMLMYQDTGGTEHHCIEFDQLPKSQLVNEQDYCKAVMGMQQGQGSTCPTNNVFGVCSYPDPPIGTLRTFYYTDDENAATAQQGCMSGEDTWTPG